MAQPAHPLLKNPQLEGDPFFWSAGPVGVLLVHGLTATTAEVRPLAQRLHAHGYTVAGPLLPGHYTRPEDLNRVTWQDWYRTVEAMYRQLQERCKRVFIGGESTGAVLTLLLASQRPEAAGVLAYAPALRLSMSAFDKARLYLSAPFLGWVNKPGPDDGLPWQGYTVNPLKGVIQLLRLQAVTLPALTKIHQPLLVMQGRQDQTVHPGVPELIERNVSSTIKEVVWMDRSRHCVIIDHELDQATQITLAFLRRVAGVDAPRPPVEHKENLA